MKTHTIKLTLAGIAIACLSCAPAYAGSNEFSVGAEGFYDDYHEPSGTLETQSGYGSITGNYTHDWTNWFAALDGRVSYGLEDYQSISGSSSGTPAWELDGRIRGGYDFKLGASNSVAPYLGVGTRYYWDEGKGVVTSLGASGYDRKITQIYIPAGVTFVHKINENFTISPNIEYDQLVWGQVSTRLGTFTGNSNVINIQHDGWGARGSIMLGWQQYGFNWQAGPFIRYWDIQASDLSSPAPGEVGEEPPNTRLQAGLALRVLW